MFGSRIRPKAEIGLLFVPHIHTHMSHRRNVGKAEKDAFTNIFSCHVRLFQS